jgi:hypothetical protein
MLQFFPFTGYFDPSMGGRALRLEEPLCVVDLESYTGQVMLKRSILSSNYRDVYRGGPETLLAQWDVLEAVLENLAAVYPTYFHLEKGQDTWDWHNDLLDEHRRFCFGEASIRGAGIADASIADASGLGCEPLEWVGRQVQEDLILLGEDLEHRFIAGMLVFPQLWSIADHLGKPYLSIHVPTPQVSMHAVTAGYRLLDHLKLNRTVWRLSWNFRLTGELDLSSRYQQRIDEDLDRRGPLLRPELAGSEVFIRIERQTFTRLPRSRKILFGIYTEVSPLEAEAADPKRAGQILRVLQEAPREVKDYKGITPIEGAITGYLESRIG